MSFPRGLRSSRRFGKFGARRGRTPLLVDIALGMIGGAVGTIAIGQAQQFFGKLQKESSRRREQELLAKPSNQVLADRISERTLGERDTGERRQKMAMGIHWGYGLFWGGVYGALHDRVPVLSRAGGIPFGLFFALVGNEVVTQAFRLVPPPQRFPVSTHVKNFASHVVYAMAADGTYRVARQVVPSNLLH